MLAVDTSQKRDVFALFLLMMVFSQHLPHNITKIKNQLNHTSIDTSMSDRKIPYFWRSKKEPKCLISSSDEDTRTEHEHHNPKCSPNKDDADESENNYDEEEQNENEESEEQFTP